MTGSTIGETILPIVKDRTYYTTYNDHKPSDTSKNYERPPSESAHNPSYAFTTAVVSFDLNLTALVAAYHVTRIKIPERIPENEFARRVFEALAMHGREVAAQGIHVGKWGVDAGGRQFPAVKRFAPAPGTPRGSRKTTRRPTRSGSSRSRTDARLVLSPRSVRGTTSSAP